jgi:membrane-associated phospholipid phosphatase
MADIHRDDVGKIALVMVLVILFAVLAVVVSRAHGPLEIDRQVEALIAPFRGSATDVPMRIATYLCSWQVIVGGAAIVVVVLLVRRQQRPAVILLVAVIGDQGIVSGLKAIIQRPRPDQTLAILPAGGTSFPSGHTFICIAFYGLLAALAVRRIASPKVRLLIVIVAAAWTLTVATSRVYLGAHWPTDVLGSGLLGSAWITFLVMFDAPSTAKPEIDGLKAD